jgi:dephospho-CoA kinase
MPINYHASETALDNYNFDYIIENNKTVKELEEEVKKVYNKIKIL